MAMKLKPIPDQVVVVLGASSGIGREIALRFAGRGAKIVAAARSEAGLISLADEITASGGQCAHAICDVADFDQVKRVAEAAVQSFGRIDTWINVAGVMVHARFENTSPDEFRRVMEVNYLGQIHGALAALPYLRQAGGGALIAISSVEGVVGMPLHSAYSASKHAVEGALEALRRELISEGVPISLTSVRPATIDTPLFNNARVKDNVKPKGPPPIYQPGVVADCVLYAAEHPVRDLYAGGAGRMMAANQMLAPKLMDAALAKIGIPLARTDEPRPGGAPGNLFSPRADDNRLQGDFGGRARRFSLYSWMDTHPGSKLLAAGTLVAAALIARGRGRARPNGGNISA